MCVLLLEPASCPSGWTDGGVAHEGAASTCACDCSKNGESCDHQQVTLYTSSSSCNGNGTTYTVDQPCDVGAFHTSFYIHEVTATATCGAASKSTAPLAGRLCCKSGL